MLHKVDVSIYIFRTCFNLSVMVIVLIIILYLRSMLINIVNLYFFDRLKLVHHVVIYYY